MTCYKETVPAIGSVMLPNGCWDFLEKLMTFCALEEGYTVLVVPGQFIELFTEEEYEERREEIKKWKEKESPYGFPNSFIKRPLPHN